MSSIEIDEPYIDRQRHELHRRTLTVVDRVELTPHMLRFTLTSDDLGNFVSASPDDHVKLFFETASGDREMRDYTPRSFDTEKRQLVLDFAVHEAGPATDWALNAQVGDTLNIGGPRGSQVIRNVRNWLLIGDETALPAIGRRIEEMGDGDTVQAIIAVSDIADQQTFETQAAKTIDYIVRPVDQAADAEPMLKALKAVSLPADCFVWIAAESSVTRVLRSYLLDNGWPKNRIKAAGYWTKGLADAAEKFVD